MTPTDIKTRDALRTSAPDTDGDTEDIAVNATQEPALSSLIEARLSRRDALKGMAALAAVTAAGGIAGIGSAGTTRATGIARNPSTLTFGQIPHVIEETHQVADGYTAQVLIRWGDKVLGNAPTFDVNNQSADAQAKQFGYNNDFIGFMPLPAGSTRSDHGLLCVSHEYTNAELMWHSLNKKNRRRKIKGPQVAVEMAAHGHSVIEIKRQDGNWKIVDGSKFARRITLSGTTCRISGPAAGHDRLKTNADPSGTEVIGTLNNCAGGKTPWGTVLIAEENFNLYFKGDASKTPEARNHKRLGINGKERYAWGDFEKRFDVEQEPNEPNRFGWMVEIDPYDPGSTPVKRTALGRFKHEGATVALMEDGRVVVYSGDDQRFEYLYKFVSSGRYDPDDRQANRNLLDDGTLFAARFDADGTLTWLPLVWGTGKLTLENDFASQADVLIEARRAADLVGATPMDRPEDVEPNPVNGRVYMMLTNNTRREEGQQDAANPRANNKFGHIVEMIPPGAESGHDQRGRTGAHTADHAAKTFKWDLVLLAGNPDDPGHGARYHPDLTTYGAWLAAPDNCAFDPKGRLWISTDQGSKQRKNGIPDGIYATDLDGPGRALTRFFYACPKDAEMCGPEFTPDGETLFVAVQHPGEASDSTFYEPSTRWPDFDDEMPPRPSVVAITKSGGGEIGS